MNCRWSSWRWGGCSKNCGRGVKYGTRHIVCHAKNGGRGCTGGSRTSKSCFVRSCGGYGGSGGTIELSHFHIIDFHNAIFAYLHI